MKTLNTQQGGHPLTLDDLSYLDSKINEGINDAIGSYFAPDGNTKLVSGCEITTNSPTDREVGAGWVYTANQFVRVQNVQLIGSGFIALAPNQVNHTPAKTYANGNTYNVYEESVFTPVLRPTFGDPGIIYLDALARLGRGEWNVVGEPGKPAFNAGWDQSGLTNVNTVAYRQNFGGRVELRGMANPTLTNSPNLIFTLPIGFRPLKDIITVTTTLFGDTANITINANGDVSCYNFTQTIGNFIFMDLIRFDNRL